MTEHEKIKKMSLDNMTAYLVRILSCRRCPCKSICKEIKATNGAGDTAPCTVAVKRYLESEV